MLKKSTQLRLKPATITSEDLLAIREGNPARFDKVVLGVGQERTPIDLAKTIGAGFSEKKENHYHIHTLLTSLIIKDVRKGSKLTITTGLEYVRSFLYRRIISCIFITNT